MSFQPEQTEPVDLSVRPGRSPSSNEGSPTKHRLHDPGYRPGNDGKYSEYTVISKKEVSANMAVCPKIRGRDGVRVSVGVWVGLELEFWVRLP
jgi:hypothetical protein